MNLFVIMAAYFVNTMMLDNTTPTLHQYVTNGRGGEVVNTNETYEVIITEQAKQVEQHTIRLLLVLARAQRGTIQKPRTAYSPVLPDPKECSNRFIV